MDDFPCLPKIGNNHLNIHRNLMEQNIGEAQIFTKNGADQEKTRQPSNDNCWNSDNQKNISWPWFSTPTKHDSDQNVNDSKSSCASPVSTGSSSSSSGDDHSNDNSDNVSTKDDNSHPHNYEFVDKKLSKLNLRNSEIKTIKNFFKSSENQTDDSQKKRTGTKHVEELDNGTQNFDDDADHDSDESGEQHRFNFNFDVPGNTTLDPRFPFFDRTEAPDTNLEAHGSAISERPNNLESIWDFAFTLNSAYFGSGASQIGGFSHLDQQGPESEMLQTLFGNRNNLNNINNDKETVWPNDGDDIGILGREIPDPGFDVSDENSLDISFDSSIGDSSPHPLSSSASNSSSSSPRHRLPYFNSMGTRKEKSVKIANVDSTNVENDLVQRMFMDGFFNYSFPPNSGGDDNSCENSPGYFDRSNKQNR